MSHGSGPAWLRFGLVSRPYRSVALQLKRPNRTEPITRADRLLESSRLTEIDHFQSFEIGSFDCKIILYMRHKIRRFSTLTVNRTSTTDRHFSDASMPPISTAAENIALLAFSQLEILLGIFCSRFALSENAMKAMLELLNLRLDFSHVKNVADVFRGLDSAAITNQNICETCKKDLNHSNCAW